MALKVGEKYLTMQLGTLKLVFFPNKNKKTDKDPDFIGQAPAIWVNIKQESKPEVEVISETI